MRVTNEQWEDSLRGERYPFAGTGAVEAESGQVLPNDVFQDLNLMVEAATADVRLAGVTVGETSAVYRFARADGTFVGALTSTAADTPLMPIVNGTVVAGYARLDTGAAAIVRGWPRQEHAFLGLRVIPHLLVVSDPAWRNGLRLPDGTILAGEAYLVADRGLRLERTGDGFAVHVTGDPFHGRTAPARGLTTVNGLTPDADGNLNLIGLAVGNWPGGVFTSAGPAFRINLKPGAGVLTLELTGAS